LRRSGLRAWRFLLKAGKPPVKGREVDAKKREDERLANEKAAIDELLKRISE